MDLIEEPGVADNPGSDVVSPARSWRLDRLVGSLTLTWETALLAVIFLAAVVTRLWGLGLRVMSHDESLHVYFSWLLSAGRGYTHNPMMHGPLLFEATALVDSLFGATDFTARLIPAVLGILLVVVIPQLLRPWLGRWGALAASILLLISPYLLYYSRYIRHDILVITWLLAAVWAILAYLSTRSDRYLWILAAALALMFATMETTFIYLAIFAAYLLAKMLAEHGFRWASIRGSAEFDLFVVLATLGAFFSAPVALLILNPLAVRLTGAPFVDLTVLSAQGVEWASGANKIRLIGLLSLFWVGSVFVGMWWDWRRWFKLAALFGVILIPLFTTFFTNLSGLGTGFIGSLGYWLSQQSVSRGAQPWYYFFLLIPLYEYLPLVGGIGGLGLYLIRRKRLSEPSRLLVPFLIWWIFGIFFAFAVAGEKMPWHSTHLVTPILLLAAWAIGQLVQGLVSQTDGMRPSRRILLALPLAVVVLLALLTVRTAYLANYVNYDYTTEYTDYAHGAPGVKWALDDIQQVARLTGDGRNLKVAYDADVSWPMTWYLREYPNSAFYGTQPNRQALDAPVVIAGPKNWTKVDTLIGQGYTRYEVIRMWWPMEDYKNLTWERVRFALTDPGMRSALWDIIWSRDYRQYAQLTHEILNPPQSWPLREEMRIYIRKDIDTQLKDQKLTAYRLPDLPAVVDAYAGLHKPAAPVQSAQVPGLNAPRNVAVGPDGSLYVVDTGNSRVIKLDPDGNQLLAWGSKTPAEQTPPAPGTLNEPWGIAVSSQGEVYVADTWNHRIQKFDANGNFLLEWGVAGQAVDGPDRFWGPRAIAIGQDGRVYVTDTGNKRVVAFDADGKNPFAFPTDGDARLDEPVGIAVGPDGRVYVADTWNMRVAVFSADGHLEDAWPVQGWGSDSLDNKPYLSVDEEGRVYLTDPEGYRVIVFSSTGEPLAVIGQYGPEPESFGMPNGLAAGADGSLWVADAGNNRLVKYAPLFP